MRTRYYANLYMGDHLMAEEVEVHLIPRGVGLKIGEQRGTISAPMYTHLRAGQQLLMLLDDERQATVYLERESSLGDFLRIGFKVVGELA